MEPFLDDGWIAAYLYETSSSEVGNLANLPRKSGSGDGRAGGRRLADSTRIFLGLPVFGAWSIPGTRQATA